MPSELYTTIRATAEKMALVINKPDDSPFNPDSFLAVQAADSKHSWGHKVWAATMQSPISEESIGNERFLTHIRYLCETMYRIEPKIHDIMVDTERRGAVVHVSYFITAKEGRERVEGEMVWTFKMTEDGKKVVRSIEFVDAESAKKIGEILELKKRGDEA